MSHSYRKKPILHDGKDTSHKKNRSEANRKLRRMLKQHIEDIDYPIKGNWYRKFSESWDIKADYVSRWTIEEAINQWRAEEILYPCIKTFFVYRVNGDGTFKKILREEYIEQGYYHKKYGTLEKYLYEVYYKQYKHK